MDVQTNRADPQAQELVEITRALAEGDFEQKLESVFHGELGQLAVHVETLRENLRALSPRFALSAHLIPEAGRGVAEMSQQAEISVNSILGLIDEMCIDQNLVTEMLGKVNGGETTALDIAKLQKIADKTSASLMSLMSFLSFQDVVRQRAEKVQVMIDLIDEKIRELLAKFKVRVDEYIDDDLMEKPRKTDASPQEEVDQTAIDDLFK